TPGRSCQCHAAGPATRRWCQRTGSSALALALVVEARVPGERAEQIEQPSLLAPRDELGQCQRHCGSLALGPAHPAGAFEEVWIDREVGGHVRTVAHSAAQYKAPTRRLPRADSNSSPSRTRAGPSFRQMTT